MKRLFKWPFSRWRINDGPTFNAGLVALLFLQGILTSIAKIRYIFMIFQCVCVRGGPDPLSPLDPPMSKRSFKKHFAGRPIVVRFYKFAGTASTFLLINSTIWQTL